MDTGAHFYNCDFQVHTPRDLNWRGESPVSDEDRMAYAERFVLECRERNLQAVGITDHHDLAFFPYLKRAAAEERDEDGNLIPPENRLVVFPGMELTLGLPCQAIILFDADFPLNLLSNLPESVLAVTQTDSSEEKHAQVTRLDRFTTLEQLQNELDVYEWLRGRYIVLPHVKEGGASTILRQGFHSKYANMPCVGGYVDGSISGFSEGWKSKVDGKNRDYGFKRIGLFQTSDSRSEDLQDLGTHTTWVKWAAPTAEALRQACLARETRISQQPPVLPAVVVQSIHVSNSKFMGPIDLELNQQFNCLIGGRGTGKSTILEYLRWALCDQSTEDAEPDTPGYQTKRIQLIDGTLVPLGATVTVNVEVNEVPHSIRRAADTRELQLKIADGEYQPCTERDVVELLPLQAYSQKQLSSVGVRTDELTRFVTASIQEELTDLAKGLKRTRSEVRSSYIALDEHRRLRKEVERGKFVLESQERQIKALQEGLSGLSDEDKAVLVTQEDFLREEESIGRWSRAVQRVEDSVKELSVEVNAAIDALGDPTEASRLIEIQAAFLQMLTNIRTRADALLEQIGVEQDDGPEPDQLIRTWRELLEAHKQAYEQAKVRSSTQETQLKQISELENRTKKAKEEQAVRLEEIERAGNLERTYHEARARWLEYFSRRGSLIEEKCAELTALAAGRIRASLKRGAGMESVRDRLGGALSGTRVGSKKIEELTESISNCDNPIKKWNEVVRDLEVLAIVDAPEDVDIEIPATPALVAAGFSAIQIEKIARQLSIDEWIEISLIELGDVPVFEYCVRENEYITFANASAGQQATALLSVLLSQDGPPLIIDQPEDDLDNQIVLDIVGEIWAAKTRRQIIFSSHNANIVVNGDADLVVVCDYRIAGDHSGGRIKCHGAIDIPQIRSEITDVMEGGRNAFELRKQKYGF